MKDEKYLYACKNCKHTFKSNLKEYLCKNCGSRKMKEVEL
jgi:Zn finger protein HypA/HybF involved in hydrogenase expression